MSKGRYQTNKTGKKWLMLLVLTAVLAALILFAVKTKPGANVTLPTEAEESGDAAPMTEASDTVAETKQDIPETAVSESVQTEPVQTETAEESSQSSTVELIQRAEADYEQWLAAAMVVGISMEYPDFELDGIYTASSTALEEGMGSQGAYILFTSEGQQLAIYSRPLNAERTDPGTKDISSDTLGFATYDAVNPDSVDTAALTRIELDDISELIAQSLLISIYER